MGALLGKYATENVLASGGIEPPERLYVTLYPQLLVKQSDATVIAAIAKSEMSRLIEFIALYRRQFLTPSYGDIVCAPR